MLHLKLIKQSNQCCFIRRIGNSIKDKHLACVWKLGLMFENEAQVGECLSDLVTGGQVVANDSIEEDLVLP